MRNRTIPLWCILPCLLYPMMITAKSHSPPQSNAEKKLIQVKPLKIIKSNINRDNAFKLSGKVKGIGYRRAQRIVAFRKAHGDFKSLRDLSEVNGISKRFVKEHWAEIEKYFTVK